MVSVRDMRSDQEFERWLRCCSWPSPGSIDRRNAFFEGGPAMYLQRDSAAGVRFLAAVKDGRGLRPSARAAGIGKATGYRWLRESFLALREQGLSVENAEIELGFLSPLMREWDNLRVDRSYGARHHLAVDPDVGEAFWRAFEAGTALEAAGRAAGVSRSTGYRWWQARFLQLRGQGLTVRAAARQLRVPPARARACENERRRVEERGRRERESAERRVVRESARHAEMLMTSRKLRSDVEVRDTRYWQLMRFGLTNTAACKLLGVTRGTGGRIRARFHQQTAAPSRAVSPPGRYLSLHERLQIADLLRLGYSMRRVAVELGRSPSTIKRELAAPTRTTPPCGCVQKRSIGRCWCPAAKACTSAAAAGCAPVDGSASRAA
jgi:transposase, IS30 family